MTITIFANCQLFDGVGEDIRDGMHIAIEGDRIREVSASAIPFAGATSDVQVVDCAGRFLMPGLIDLHCHAYGATFDMHQLDRMPKALLVSHASKHLEGALQRGFTTVRDPGGGDIGLALAIQRGLIAGPRFLYGGRALSQTGGHGDMRIGSEESLCNCNYSGVICQVVDGPENVRQVVREELRKGADHIKVFVTGGVASPNDPVWMPQFTDEELGAAVGEATSRGKYVMAHCHTDDGAKRCALAGVRSIEHATDISDQTAALIAKLGACTVPTLAVVHQLSGEGSATGMHPDRRAKVSGMLQQMLRSIEICRRAGVKVGLGTDLFGADFQHLQSSEFRFRAEVDSPIDVLRSATSVNAEIAMVGDSIGRIEVGYSADLILLDTNPLKDLGVFERYRSEMPVVMRAGKFARNALQAS